MAATLTGDKALDRKLKRLGDKVAKRVSAQGVRAALRVIAKGIKSEIPASQKSARKAIGTRFMQSKKNGVTAVVGGSKFTTDKIEGGVTKAKASHGKGKKPGVGISKNNIHWILLGTGQRTQNTTGRRTGIMPAVGAVKRGFAKTEAAAIKKIQDTIRKGIAREAAKK